MALKGWNRLYRAVKEREREREGEKQGLLTREEGKRGTLGRRRIAAGEEIAGEGAKPPERAERAREWRSSVASGSGAGWRPFFKMQHGRTGQFTVPVRCTPDSAQ